ncbi:hypothetical protein Golomagni_07520, partial [Golovinomyces magnicellulatus]
SRYFTRERARELGITGWCRNTTDNKVEGEAQGEEDSMKEFMTHLEKGPRHATVVQLTQEPRDIVTEEGFTVTR